MAMNLHSTKDKRITTCIAWTCQSNLHWEKTVYGSTGNEYVVMWGKLPKENLFAYICTCNDFRYKGFDTDGKWTGHECKHIRQVQYLRCGWNEDFCVSSEPLYESGEKPICPSCYGPVATINVVV